jgi:outer membrane protein assembly factor BamB
LVDAEPLYVSSVTINSVTHNVLIVVTEHGSVYAFDADKGTKLWRVTTLKSGETTSDDRNCNQIVPEIGISSTPVISRAVKPNGIIYTVAMSKDSSGNYHQRLHALDVTTGKELYNGPVDIAAKYPGTGDNSSNGYVIFDPSQYKERSGLLLMNGQVYLAWASHCDIRPYTGWIMAYNSTTLAQSGVINVTPNGNQGAIWGSGAGLTADGAGNIFFLDANGLFDGSLNAAGFPVYSDYGNAFIRLNIQGGALNIADYFEVDNQIQENDADVDLGSGGALILPNMKDSDDNIWKLAVGAGKDSNIYVVNRNFMGKFSPNGNYIYQELAGVLPGGVWSMPAYFNGLLFYGPTARSMLAFQFKNARLLPAPVAQTTTVFEYPGTTPSISSNMAQNAIVWAAENSNLAVLHAYNAANLQEIYNSTQAAGGRDNFGAGNKFITPMINNGKVFVGTTNSVGVFGLLK